MNDDELNKQQKLLELLKGDSYDKAVDRSQLRYGLYVRKSTAGDEKQESSIEDQIRDCMEKVIIPQDLNLVDTYSEKVSAKTADVREDFKRLVKDIYLGRIDGLIAWHPDRLSRNMKEAGMIIDLIDTGFLQDLQFPTFTFENTPAGKMLLGITFVMAKQYSEHLSESVGRGNRRATEDGEFIGKFKHGYIVDSSRHLQPDPDSFVKVKHMFELALEKESQKNIREWINRQNYTVQKRPKAEPEVHVWSKDDVSNLLKDPLYTGVFRWGESYTNLSEIYQFEQMLSVDDFLRINKIENLDSPKIITINKPKGGNIRSNLLRGLVYCGHCNKSLTSMLIDKKKDGEVYQSRYYYKCETVNCEMEGKSARAGRVIDAAQTFFSTYLFVTRNNYETLMKSARVQIKKTQYKLDSSIATLKVTIGKKTSSYERVKKLIENDTNGNLTKHYNLDEMLSEIEGLQSELNRLVSIRKESFSALPTYGEYLKLFESTPVILNKIRDMKQMDGFLRTFFSNFTITATGKDFRQGSEVTYKLKEPWNGFLENGDFSLGAG